MGCRPSKADDLPLVIRCRERKRLIKSAAGYRYDLSSSHLAYFHSLKDIGYALSRFVDEQLVIPSPPLSASPVLTLPSDLGKSGKNNGSMSSGSISHIHIIDDGHEGSESESDSGSGSGSSLDGHGHGHDDGNAVPFSNYSQPHDYNNMDFNEPAVVNRGPQPSVTNWGGTFGNDRGPMPYQPPWGEPYGVDPSAFQYQPPWGANQPSWGAGQGVGEVEGDPYVMNPQFQSPWGGYQENFDSYNGYGGNAYANTNHYVSYMKKSAPASHTVIQQGEARAFQK